MNIILKALQKIESWEQGSRFAPHEVEIYPTNRCNLRCRFCLQRVASHDYSGELSADAWLQIIRQGAELGVEAWVLLGGGEPFARKAVTVPVIREIKRLGMHGTVITNGTLFTEDMIREMVELEWDSILFSLETHQPETQDYLMDHVGAFEKITSAIARFHELKLKTNKRLPRLVLQPTVTAMNYSHMLGLHHLSYKLGVEFLCFKTYEAFTPESKLLRLNSDQKQQFFKEAQEAKAWSDSVGLLTNIHQFRDNSQRCDYNAINTQLASLDSRLDNKYMKILCHMPWRKMTIKADGGVEPCVGINRGGLLAGRTLEQVWLSPEFNHVRQELIRNHRLPECRFCGYGIPVTTYEKLKFISRAQQFPELSVFDLEIVAD